MSTNKWFWGVFFICAAAAVILNALGYLADVSVFSIIFTIILIPIIVKSLFHRFFAGVFFPLAIIGILYSKPLHIESLSPWPLLGAALFLSIAFSIMFKSRKFLTHLKAHHYKRFNRDYDETIEYVDDNEIDCIVSLGASTKYIHCTALKKANLSSSLGALKIFFDNAELDPAGAVMNLDCSLGSIEMYLPKKWRIENHVNTVLGAVEEKNKYADPGVGPLLTMNGEVSLGAITIIYV